MEAIGSVSSRQRVLAVVCLRASARICFSLCHSIFYREQRLQDELDNNCRRDFVISLCGIFLERAIQTQEHLPYATS